MKFINTKVITEKVGFLEAVERGVGSLGGLFVPEEFPQFNIDHFNSQELSSQKLNSQHFNSQEFNSQYFKEVARNVLIPFMEDDFSIENINSIVTDSFNFPIPLNTISDFISQLELFHGPTAAFKDVAARFIASVMDRSANKPKTILVATSGDTGGAVAAAFYRRSGFRVVILFPDKGVSDLQRRQLTGWGENIISLAVNGSFDQCQSLVKEMLATPSLVSQYHFTSANSINIARLLPQACYYAASSLWWWHKHKTKAHYIIPTGNMGNALGAVWARLMGFPIDHITMATNANAVIPDYFRTGIFNAKPSVSTLANAMDVGNPSNFARLHFQFPKLESLLPFCSAVGVSDEEIKDTIRLAYHDYGIAICPHTATAYSVALQRKLKGIIVATAHPAKFKEVIEPLIQKSIAPPPSLMALIENKSFFVHKVDPVVTDVLSNI